MSIEVLSIIGLFVGLGLLMYLALKGVSLYILAPLSAVVVAIFSGMNVLDALSIHFMEGFAGFMQNFFLIFMLSSIFANIMGDSGVARVIAYKIAGLIRKSNPKYQRLLAVLSIGIMTAILTLGGINLYCCVFVLVTIGKDLFEEFDIPWHLYMTSSIGSGGFTMTMMPGTPSLQNLIPIQYLGTTPTAAPVLGIISSMLCIIFSVMYIKYALTKCDKKGEGFLPTGAKVKSANFKDDEALPDINLLKALIPSIVLLIVLNGFKQNAIVALFVAIVVSLLLFWKNLKDNNINVLNTLTEGTKNSILVILNVCVIVGFGRVVAATPGYSLIMASLDKIPGPPIVQLIIAVNIAAGICGSASGGLSIGMELFAERFLELGISPDIMHRMALMSSGGLDSLPHSSGTASALGVAQLTHKEGYIHVFWLNTVIPLVVTIIGVILIQIGIV